eukprot:1408181-Pleurochrysis_carterae.AAC.1
MQYEKWLSTLTRTNVYALLTKCLFRKCLIIRCIVIYFVGDCLYLDPPAKVNIVDYYLAASSIQNINMGIMHSIGYVFDLFYFYCFYATLPDTFKNRDN